MASPASFVIDCDTCPAHHSEACDDCVVTYVCNQTPGDALLVDFGDLRALHMLSEGGLVPRLRHPAVAMR